MIPGRGKGFTPLAATGSTDPGTKFRLISDRSIRTSAAWAYTRVGSGCTTARAMIGLPLLAVGPNACQPVSIFEGAVTAVKYCAGPGLAGGRPISAVEARGVAATPGAVLTFGTGESAKVISGWLLTW